MDNFGLTEGWYRELLAALSTKEITLGVFRSAIGTFQIIRHFVSSMIKDSYIVIHETPKTKNTRHRRAPSTSQDKRGG